LFFSFFPTSADRDAEKESQKQKKILAALQIFPGALPMKSYRPALAVGVVLLLTLPASAAPMYSLKVVADSAPPKEVQAPIRKLLNDQCVRLLDGKGNTMMELWFSKEVAVKATEAQIKNGLTYREVPISTILGVVRVPKVVFDYRKQKIPAGVYTLRLANQPMDGDHMGTAPYAEFCVLSPAADDKKPDLMDAKTLNELSSKTTESHPGVMLLFPGKTGKEPKLENKGMGHWVLMVDVPAKAGDKKATLPVGLVLVGVSASV